MSLSTLYSFRHLVSFLIIRQTLKVLVLILKWPLLPLIIAPKHKGKGASDCNMSKQSHKMLPVNEKVYKFFTWDKRERNVEVVEIDSMISVVAAVKKEKRIYAIVLVTSQATSVTATHRVWQVQELWWKTPVVSDICRGSWNIAIISWYFCSFFHNENIFCLGKTFCLLSACCISMRSGFNSQNPWYGCVHLESQCRGERRMETRAHWPANLAYSVSSRPAKNPDIKKKVGATWRTADVNMHAQANTDAHMHTHAHSHKHMHTPHTWKKF